MAQDYIHLPEAQDADSDWDSRNNLVQIESVDPNEREKERFAKENHSEIERRRRNKMTTFINELADLIPSCNQQKPDKLSILRFAAAHCKGMNGARNHTPNEPSLLSLNKFDHLVWDTTRGCLFILDQTDLVIYAASQTSQRLTGLTEDQLLRTSFLSLIHKDDVKTCQEMLCSSTSYSRRMLDLKNFQIREESFTPGRCNPSTNEKREFLTRIKVNTPISHYGHKRNGYVGPSNEEGYIVVSISATVVGPVDYITDQSCWTVFVRQEQPQQIINKNQSCTIKIGLNGDVLFCDDLLTNILNLPTSDVERIIGKKIWEVLFERRHESEMELKELVSKGANQEQKADIALASKGKILGWASLVLRPIINPSSKKTEFIIGSLSRSENSGRHV